MLIEVHHPVVSKRAEPIEVPMGSQKYLFEFDANGCRVAEVWIESHIEAFLALKAMYRPLNAAPAEPQAASEPSPMKRPDIMRALKDRGVPFKATQPTAELQALLTAPAAAA